MGALVPVVRVSVEAPVLIQDAHAQIVSRRSWIDSNIKPTDAKGEQFITDAGFCIEPKIGDLVELVRSLDTHVGVRW